MIAIADVADQHELGARERLDAARVHAQLEGVHHAAQRGIDEHEIRLVAIELVRRVRALARGLDVRGGMRATGEAPQPACTCGVVVDDQHAQRPDAAADAFDDRVELEQHVRHRARTRRGLLREQPVDEIRQLARQVVAQVRDPRRRVLRVALELAGWIRVGERRLAGRELDRDAAQAIEIDRLGGRRVGGLDLAAHDLGREDLAVGAKRRHLRQRQPAEHEPVIVDEHGRPRDVADGDAGLVGARDRGDERAKPREVPIGRQLLRELDVQQVPHGALGDRELDAVVGAHAVHLHRARIADRRAPPRLRDQRRRAGVAPGELERDGPVEQHVARVEHDAVVGAGDLVLDLVGRRDHLAGVQRAVRAVPEPGGRRERSETSHVGPSSHQAIKIAPAATRTAPAT
jgi:hypothetical protein